mgnify:CR=1 FL=1
MIFVTGGTGFVGAHLLRHLVEEDQRIVALKRPTGDTGYTRRVFETYSGDAGNLFHRIDWVEGDVLDYMSLEKPMEGADRVYHAAAMVSFDPGKREAVLQTNIRGTANVVNAALEQGVSRIVYVSSVAALDPPKEDHPIDEQQFGNLPTRYSAYAESKFQGELEIWRGVEEGLQALVVNPSVIMGPLAPADGPGGFFHAIRGGLPFYPGGITGFVDVRDVCRAITELTAKDLFNERFILSRDNYSYRYVFETIARVLNVKPPRRRLHPALTATGWRLEWLRAKLTGSPPRLTREMHQSAHRQVAFSNRKLKEAIGFQYTPIEQTIADTARHMKPSGPKKKSTP